MAQHATARRSAAAAQGVPRVRCVVVVLEAGAVSRRRAWRRVFRCKQIRSSLSVRGQARVKDRRGARPPRSAAHARLLWGSSSAQRQRGAACGAAGWALGALNQSAVECRRRPAPRAGTQRARPAPSAALLGDSPRCFGSLPVPAHPRCSPALSPHTQHAKGTGSQGRWRSPSLARCCSRWPSASTKRLARSPPRCDA